MVDGRTPVNRLAISATLAQVAPLRYTPAGIPVLDLLLSHESTLEAQGQDRRVRLELKAQAYGAAAETLANQALGSGFEFLGFLAGTRNAKGIVFQIQDFKQT